MYNYTEKNILDHPQSYMYSSFYGEIFIDKYYENRRSFVKKLSKFDEHQDNQHEIWNISLAPFTKFKGDVDKFQFVSEEMKSADYSVLRRIDTSNNQEFCTYDNLLSMLEYSCAYPKKSIKFIKEDLDFLVQKFEVSKKIFEFYNLKEKTKSGSYSNIKVYYLFAVLVSVQYFLSKNLKYLNTIIKLVDLFISLENSNLIKKIPSNNLINLIEFENVSIKYLIEK